MIMNNFKKIDKYDYIDLAFRWADIDDGIEFWNSIKVEWIDYLRRID